MMSTSNVGLARVEIPDGDGSVRGASFPNGKAGRAAVAGKLPPDC